MERILDFDPVSRASGPWLRCPIPPAVHDDVARAREASLAWAVEMGLSPADAPALRVLRAARFADLAARTYTYATPEQLQLGADWASLLFFCDDLVDTTCCLRGRVAEEELVKLDAGIVAALRGERWAPRDVPLCMAAADIRSRLLAIAAPGWIDRLADDMELYLDGVRWERAIEREQAPLTLATYRHMRPMISAVPTVLDLGGAFLCPDRPDIGRQPLVAQLAHVVNNHICWINDIYGLDRELAHGQRANLVIAMATSEGISFREALDRSIVICNAEMDTFVALEQHLHEASDGQVDPFVLVLCRWIRGNLDWHAESGRYRDRTALAPAGGRITRECQPTA